jgi:hypothetical protein
MYMRCKHQDLKDGTDDNESNGVDWHRSGGWNKIACVQPRDARSYGVPGVLGYGGVRGGC